MVTLRRAVAALVILSAMILLLILVVPSRDNAGPTETAPTPTLSYHEQFPNHDTATPAGGHNQPLPAAQDPTSAGAMSAAANSMIQAADGMDMAAATLIAASDPSLVELGQHWQQDAHALRERGAWMIISATSESMVHDPDRVRQVDLVSLRANGIVMAEEGRAMIAHGQDMMAEAAELRNDGSLSSEDAEALNAGGQALVAQGQRLEQDGEEMEETADSLLRSLGR